MKRVVVTGMGAITALGDQWPAISAALQSHTSGIRAMPEWRAYKNLGCQIAGAIDFTLPAHYPRKKLRTMGRVAQLAVRASELALTDAGLLDDPLLQSGDCGLAYGSSTGSIDATCEFADMLIRRDLTRVSVSNYIRMMSHTAAVNVGIFFGVKGRVYPTTSACTSGSQAIGYAYEAIQSGKQILMIAGGAEELCPSEAAVFDTFHAASRQNDTPQLTPRPFDRDRDGLVIGEGGATLILEEYEHARSRGAKIYAEVAGFGTNADGGHVTLPDAASMQRAIELALKDAAIDPAAVGYISAHGTATGPGDISEAEATARVFGDRVAISSLKGHLGHTLGASGAIEALASIHFMREGWAPPTLHLDTIDPACEGLDFIQKNCRALSTNYVISNNFAFGGINTALVFKHLD